MAADQTKSKPVLKWAGGKRRLLPQILARMSPAVAKEGHIETYVEPFFGGGAMFFHLAEHFSFDRVVINDFNPCVQDHSIGSCQRVGGGVV